MCRTTNEIAYGTIFVPAKPGRVSLTLSVFFMQDREFLWADLIRSCLFIQVHMRCILHGLHHKAFVSAYWKTSTEVIEPQEESHSCSISSHLVDLQSKIDPKHSFGVIYNFRFY